MIKAEFWSDGGQLIGFRVHGHAGYDDYGFDIVCASVSSAVELVCNTITETFNHKAEVVVEDNLISLKLLDCPKDSPCVKVLEGLRLHFEGLSERFQKNVKVYTTEV